MFERLRKLFSREEENVAKLRALLHLYVAEDRHEEACALLEGIKEEREQNNYAELIRNALMPIYDKERNS